VHFKTKRKHFANMALELGAAVPGANNRAEKTPLTLLFSTSRPSIAIAIEKGGRFKAAP
jgi:hypothetical protein